MLRSVTIIYLSNTVFSASSPCFPLHLSVVGYQGSVKQILFLCFCALSCLFWPGRDSWRCLYWWGNHCVIQHDHLSTVVSKEDIHNFVEGVKLEIVCSIMLNLGQMDLQCIYCKQTLMCASSRGKSRGIAPTMTCRRAGQIFSM